MRKDVTELVWQVWISQGLPSGAVPEGHQGEPDPGGHQPGHADAHCQEYSQQVDMKLNAIVVQLLMVEGFSFNM